MKGTITFRFDELPYDTLSEAADALEGLRLTLIQLIEKYDLSRPDFSEARASAV